MNLNEDMGGGGFKFKKRERKHRIKTPAEKQEDEESKAEAAISITEIINQAHHTPSKSFMERDNMERGSSAEDSRDKGVKAENNAEGANAEANEGEENAPEEDGPKPDDSMEVGDLTTSFDNPEVKAKVAPTPRKALRFKQRKSKEFKSKPPKKGVLGFGEDIPGMDGLGTDITVICPWEAFNHLELHELSQFGII